MQDIQEKIKVFNQFFSAVKEMRALQQLHEKTRHPTYRHNARTMENIVDILLVKIPEQLKPKQTQLFEP